MVTILYVLASTLKAFSIRIEDIRLSGMSLQEAEMVVANVKAFTAISGFFTPIFLITVMTVIYFILLKLAKKQVSFKEIFSMNSYLFVIEAVGVLINSLLWLVIDHSVSGSFITSLGAILNSEFPPFYSIELFSIWHYIVLAIGFQAVGQLSKKVSVIWVILLFIIEIFLSYYI